MKKTILIPFVVLTLGATTSQAGFLGALAGGFLQAGINAGTNTVKNAWKNAKETSSANTYLWEMHKNKKYAGDYKEALNYLENNSNNIKDLDTVAWVYKDNGQINKARNIYEKRIIPQLDNYGNAEKEKFLGYYIDNFASKSDIVKMKQKQENEAKRQAQDEKNRQIEQENARVAEQNKENFRQTNIYVWNMHEKGVYSQDWQTHVKYLEDNSKDLHHLDTVAWAYYDNKDKVKAIEIYKTKILPNLSSLSEEKQKILNENFVKLSN
jgi:hypothetical protein